MTTQEFVLALVGTLAWPASVLTVALIVRHEINKVLDDRSQDR